MGATLGIANERNAYTITDRGTYLALAKRVSLPILIEGDKALLNIYSVMEFLLNLRRRGIGDPDVLRAMLSWSMTFLIIGLIAAVLGMSGIAGAATQIAWILFVLFIVLFLISLVTGSRRTG